MPDHTLTLVFVHGFRGNNKTFQSFPIDLHLHLSPEIPQLQTFVYPTYKTKKSLSLARDDLLNWMKNLAPGGVILCGHSMGGILTAEVAFAAPPGRVIGLISFDVPYLGMHPRVVISGIASLFKTKVERVPNQGNVSSINGPGIAPKQLSGLRTPGANNPEIASSTTPLVRFQMRSSALSDTPITHPSAINPNTNLPTSLHLSLPTPPIRVSAPRFERLFQTLGLGPLPQSVHNTLHFLQKHPGICGIKDGIAQTFQFIGCLFNPKGLMARYERLQQWGSDETAGPYGRGWVNLWTTPMPKPKSKPKKEKMNRVNGTRALQTDGQERNVVGSPVFVQAGVGHAEACQSTSTFFSSAPSETSPSASTSRTYLFQAGPSLSSIATSFGNVDEGPESPAGVTSKELRNYMPIEALPEEDQALLQSQESLPGVELEVPDEEPAIAPQDAQLRANVSTKETKKLEKERRKFLKTITKRARNFRAPSRHFIVLPRQGTDHQWIQVPVIGAKDEVEAHVGLFYSEGNPGYQQLVEDVGNIVRGFWHGEGGRRHLRA